jgi:hypothetical protein
MLAAAGFAPAFRHSALDDPALTQVRAAIVMLLESHRPYPALVIDHHWNLVDANPPAAAMVGLMTDPSSPAVTDPLNVMRLVLHPEGLRRHIANWDELAPSLAARVRRDAQAAPEDATLQQLAAELLAFVDAPGTVDPGTHPDLVVPVHYRLGDVDVRMFSTLASIGSPMDVTVSELEIELFFPADAASAETLRTLGDATPDAPAE